jgi:hypothetical protein
MSGHTVQTEQFKTQTANQTEKQYFSVKTFDSAEQNVCDS